MRITIHENQYKEFVMKRFFCVVLVAVFATALCFAQELKFDGYLNSGIGLWMSNEEDNDDPQLMIYGVDSERFFGRFRLNGAYANADQTAGANFRLQVQGTGSRTEFGNIPTLAFGYGWIKLADMFTIKAGLVDDGTWATGDGTHNDDQGEGAGVLVRATPITGLDLGVGAYVASYESGSNNNVIPVLPSQFVLDEAKYTFNAAYTMDKVFRLMLSGRTKNETEGDSAAKTSHALAEFRLLSINNLTAVVVGELNKLDDYSDSGETNFYETISYRMGDLSFGLNAAQYLRNVPSGSDAANDLALRLNPWVSFALNEGKMVPRLDVVYFMGGRQNGTNYHRKAFSTTYDADSYVINARPSVRFNLDNRTSFEVGDSFYYNMPGKDADGVINNVFYADFIIRF